MRVTDGSAPRRWQELDLLRALAAGLMVFNHVAVESSGIRTSQPIATAAFIGSFAPVLFFFLTGLGSGIQSASRKPSAGYGYLVKVIILLAAGFDFFRFIGLSMLALEWVRRAPRSGRLAFGLSVAVCVARFVAGPLLRPWLVGRWGLVLGGVLGVEGSSWPGYAFCPWLFYPFFGFALGQLAAQAWSTLEPRRYTWVFVLAGFACLLGAITAMLSARGAEMFRYGTMSAAYFLASLSALALSLAAAIALAPVSRRVPPPWSGFIALSGIRSFAVVPLHYALIPLADAVLGPCVDATTYLRNTLTILVVSFAASALVEKAARYLDAPSLRRPTWIILVAFTAAYRLGLLKAPAGASEDFLRTAMLVGLCVLLVLHRPQGARAERQALAEPEVAPREA